VRRETVDCVSVAFSVPAPLHESYVYLPGQYLTLKVNIDGTEVRRAYSICTAPHEADLRVAIKRIDHGLFSTFANTRLSVGDIVEVGTPDGRFVLPNTRSAEQYCLVAAGSGITPTISIAKTVLFEENLSKVVLIYGNRNLNSVIFRGEIERLKSRFPSRLTVVHVLTREDQKTDAVRGRLDDVMLSSIVKSHFPSMTGTEFYICGPAALIDMAKISVLSMGVQPGAIHSEQFHAEPPVQKSEMSDVRRHTGVSKVTIVHCGSRSYFEVPFDGETILDAGTRQGMELPHSCRSGVCASCRCLLVSGTVEMTEGPALESWEREKGFVLACQSRPSAQEIVLDFDAI